MYRLARLTVFSQAAEGRPIKDSQLVDKLLNVSGYLPRIRYTSAAVPGLSLYVVVQGRLRRRSRPQSARHALRRRRFHKLFGKKFVFDHHDLSPELYQSRYKSASGVVSRVSRPVEKLSLKVANVVIATNESYRAIDIARHGSIPSSVFIVRNGPDLRRVSSSPTRMQQLQNIGRRRFSATSAR